jgi:adenosylhomocysteine nucleosidase
MQTLVTMALKVESAGLFESAGFPIFYTGVGATSAAFHLTQWLHEHKPLRVINLGTVGSHQFQKGHLVECTSFVQRKANSLSPYTSETLNGSALTDLPKAICGSADFIEAGAPLTKCDVFDMEAYTLAFVCKKMNTPFHSLKFVTDSSDQNLITDWKAHLKISAESLLGELRKL